MAALLETKEWGHACEFEASLNLVACPELVNFKALKGRHFPTFPVPPVSPAATPLSWVSAHPEMAVGFPQKATAAKGEKFVELWVGAIVDTLRKIKRDRRGPAVLADYNRRVRSVHRAAGRIP